MATDRSCRLGWGMKEALELAREGAGLFVVVDVLSFSTTVSIATSRGTSVVPSPPGQAEQLAGRIGAEAASDERAGSRERPWSLSPSRMASSPVAERVVLASPNGAAIAAALSEEGVAVLAGCMRNRRALTGWLRAGHGQVAVIAAGEHRSDGRWRPALEDLVGAGLICADLAEAGFLLDGEARRAARGARFLAPGGAEGFVRASISAADLYERGFGKDVDLAVEEDGDEVVPLLRGSPGFRPSQGPGKARLN